MSIEILAAYQNLAPYVAALEGGAGSPEALWEEYAIGPYWDRLTQYAPFDLSERKPKAPTGLASLKRQLSLLNRLDLGGLQKEFERAASALPNYDDDAILVALYPHPDEEGPVRRLQNGVVGTSTFGHILISVNPLAPGFDEWIPYVFAHEYHHTVWGNYWYAKHGGELSDQFVNSLVIDGEADAFACSLYPRLKPRWLDMTERTEALLWKEHYARLLTETGVDYPKYMFGSESDGIPWCAGYAVGERIVRRYLDAHRSLSFRELLEIRPMDIYEQSGYAPTL